MRAASVSGLTRDRDRQVPASPGRHRRTRGNCRGRGLRRPLIVRLLIIVWLIGTLEAERQADAPAILVECVIERGSVLGSFTQSMVRAPWISEDQVAITQANAPEFAAWYRAHDSVAVAGESLAAWQQWSARSDKLPAAVCGPDATDPSGMQHEVFSGDPAAGNPWGN